MRTNRLDFASLGLLASALLIPTPVHAQVSESTESTKPTADVQAVLKDFDATYRAWLNGYKKNYKAASKTEQQAILAKRPLPTQYFSRLFEIIDTVPAATDTFAAAEWMVTRGGAKGSDLERLLGILTKHHLDDPQLADFCRSLGRTPSEQAASFLRSLEQGSPHNKVKGQACLSLANLKKSQASLSRRLKTADGKRLEAMATFYGRSTVKTLKIADPESLEKAAEKHYAAVMANPEYSAISYGRSRTLGAVAKSNLFELRNLSIGKVAPEIIGEDLDGNAMKLSDYRGKVVVIDFWGDW